MKIGEHYICPDGARTFHGGNTYFSRTLEVVVTDIIGDDVRVQDAAGLTSQIVDPGELLPIVTDDEVAEALRSIQKEMS
jgi:hypothetical protein